jgi:hydroxymethylglutaryl-CoA reductase
LLSSSITIKNNNKSQTLGVSSINITVGNNTTRSRKVAVGKDKSIAGKKRIIKFDVRKIRNKGWTTTLR